MSYIIKGILGGKLPWALVLLGAMIAIVLEMSSIPSLAFAVGVYLPLSSSSPILIGGMIRWAVDRYLKRKHAGKNLTEDQLIAETDKSPGVLMASGYIAGGAIAGIIIAFMAGVLSERTTKIEHASILGNPFFNRGIRTDWKGEDALNPGQKKLWEEHLAQKKLAQTAPDPKARVKAGKDAEDARVTLANDGVYAEEGPSGTKFSTEAAVSADVLALIPFVILILLLYLTGREIILRDRKKA
jgi:hypothetical protein